MRGELDQSCSANPAAVKFPFNSACVRVHVLLCVRTGAHVGTKTISGEQLKRRCL